MGTVHGKGGKGGGGGGGLGNPLNLSLLVIATLTQCHRRLALKPDNLCRRICILCDALQREVLSFDDLDLGITRIAIDVDAAGRSNNAQFGIGPYSRIARSRTHLALVLRIVLERCVLDLQVVCAMRSIDKHRVPWEAGNDCRKAKRESVLGPLHLAGPRLDLAAQKRIGALQYLQIVRGNAESLHSSSGGNRGDCDSRLRCLLRTAAD